MSMTPCPACGKEIDNASQFCSFCGAKIPPVQQPENKWEEARVNHRARESTAANNAPRPSLLQYLQSAICIETDIETQKLIIQDYDRSRNDIKPELVQKPLPEKPTYHNNSGWTDSEIGTLVSLGFAGIVSLVGAWMLKEYIGIALVFLIVAAFPLTVVIMAIYNGCKNARRTEEKNNRLAMKYRNSKETIESENARQAAKYHENIRIWQAANDTMHEKFNVELAASREALEKLYALNFIYPKYRTLPALTSICEYFMSGRCTALEGPNGAYNLYENELRMNTIISQLSTIIENLEAIKQNQYMLYQQVSYMTGTVQAIHNEVCQIKGYSITIAQLTSLNAYYSAVTARNAQIMTLCHIL